MQQDNHEDRLLDASEMSLRDRLLVAQAAEAVSQPHSTPVGPNHHHVNSIVADSTFSSDVMDADDEPEFGPDGKRVGKRELSGSKRAAQNRAAQRAFRQRKESYIKKLEEQVRTFSVMEASYKHTQVENYELRAYILQLQARLLETQGSFPPAPPSLSGDNARHNPIDPLSQISSKAHDIISQPSRLAAITAPLTSPEPPQRQQQQFPKQQQHRDILRYESREPQIEPAAVEQLKAAAAAAHAADPVEERENKYRIGRHDQEQAYAIEAARAAAYAASKPSVEPQEPESSPHLNHLHNDT